MRSSRFGILGNLAAAAAAMAIAPAAIIEPDRPSQAVQRTSRQRVQVSQHRPVARLNRSRRWPYAETYADARAISPFPNRPVR